MPKFWKSGYAGDNKSAYSNEGVGPYSRSYPKFKNRDGTVASPRDGGNGGGRRQTPTDEIADPESHSGSFSGKGMSSKLPKGKGQFRGVRRGR